jgi:hypothetical protein
MSVDSALATCGVSGVGELCDDHADGRSSEGYGDEHEPEPLSSFTEVHVAYTTVKSLFMSTALLNLELVLFHPKQKVLTKQFAFTVL